MIYGNKFLNEDYLNEAKVNVEKYKIVKSTIIALNSILHKYTAETVEKIYGDLHEFSNCKFL